MSLRHFTFLIFFCSALAYAIPKVPLSVSANGHHPRGHPARPHQTIVRSSSATPTRPNSNSGKTVLFTTSQPLDDIIEGEIVSEAKQGLAYQLNAFELCICGALATALGDLAMHPIDTIKITQQTATVAKGLLGTAKDIVLSRGFLGLYQGVVPYLIGDGLSGAVKFATFELSRRVAEKKLPEKYHAIARFACAAFAMLACSFILVPGEVLKTRLQAGAALTMTGAIQSILQSEGVRGLYVGYKATLVRDVPYTMLELGLYENLKSIFRRFVKRETLTTKEELIAAAITGGFTAIVTTPLDLIKTRLMMQTSAGGKYSGVFDALSCIYQEGGLLGLFVGCMARITWLLPFTIIYLGVYEFAKRWVERSKAKALAV
eukprot:scaffold14723_cov282-Ochromonas_danica.AAC.7